LVSLPSLLEKKQEATLCEEKIAENLMLRRLMLSSSYHFDSHFDHFLLSCSPSPSLSRSGSWTARDEKRSADEAAKFEAEVARRRARRASRDRSGTVLHCFAWDDASHSLALNHRGS
jgi:hypothetical protein